MNQLAYTTLVAFLASLLTLVAAALLVPVRSESGTATISREELARHDGRDSCWKAIDGRVYDVTDYIDRHPTPPEVLTDWCGRESSGAWHDKGDGSGHSAFAGRLLAEFEVGVLEGAEPAPRPGGDSEPRAGASATVSEAAYADGSYYVESEPDARGYIAILEFSVRGGRILGVGFDEIRRDEEGQVTYRKSADLNYAQRWRAVSGVSQLSAYDAYERQLAESGHPDGVDALSGATSAHASFTDLARQALADQ